MHIIYAIQNRLSCEPAFVYALHIQCKYRDKLHLLILWKTYEAKSIVQYNRLITLQHGHCRADPRPHLVHASAACSIIPVGCGG